MSEILRSITQNPFITILSLALGLFGIILAIVFFVKSHRFKAVRYEVLSRTIIEDLASELDGLEVRYNQVPQQRVTVARAIIWNAGTDTINGSDLTSLAPFQILFEQGAELLDARIIFASEAANQFKIGPPNFPTDAGQTAYIRLSFDYLDRQDGVVIQLVHTGESPHMIRVEGKIKGADPIARLRSPAYRGFPRPIRALVGSKIVAWVGVLIYFAIGVSTAVAFAKDSSRWYFLPITAFCIFGTWVMYTAYAKEQLPLLFRRHLD